MPSFQAGRRPASDLSITLHVRRKDRHHSWVRVALKRPGHVPAPAGRLVLRPAEAEVLAAALRAGGIPTTVEVIS